MLELLGDATLAGLVDRALERLVAVQMRLGFFDARERLPMGWGLLGAEVVDSEAHRALAKEAADQSLVLLKNERATLPLATATVTPRRKVAVIGRHANATNGRTGRSIVDYSDGLQADRRFVYVQDGLGSKIITESECGCCHLTAPIGCVDLRSSSSASCSRRIYFWTLPVTVIGNSSTKWT